MKPRTWQILVYINSKKSLVVGKIHNYVGEHPEDLAISMGYKRKYGTFYLREVTK